jgi:hypothetical protein
MARKESLDTIWFAANWAAAHDDFPEATGPIRTTRLGAGMRRGGSAGVAIASG